MRQKLENQLRVNEEKQIKQQKMIQQEKVMAPEKKANQSQSPLKGILKKEQRRSPEKKNKSVPKQKRRQEIEIEEEMEIDESGATGQDFLMSLTAKKVLRIEDIEEDYDENLFHFDQNARYQQYLEDSKRQEKVVSTNKDLEGKTYIHYKSGKKQVIFPSGIIKDVTTLPPTLSDLP